MELGFNDFEVGYIHYSGHWKGWALKISTFFGPEMATSESKSFRRAPYKQQVHLLVRQERRHLFVTRLVVY
jgi:hypothetical protein